MNNATVNKCVLGQIGFQSELKDELGLDVTSLGGSIQEEGFKCYARIDGVSKTVNFLVGGCQQKLLTFKYEVPEHWVEKYGLNQNGNHYSVGGTNRITIGNDQIWLHSQSCETSQSLGVQILKSSITGKYLLAGRAVDSDDNGGSNFQHKAIIGSGTESTNVLPMPFRQSGICLLYTSPSPRDVEESRMPSSA